MATQVQTHTMRVGEIDLTAGAADRLGLFKQPKPLVRLHRQYDWRLAWVLGIVENADNALRLPLTRLARMNAPAAVGARSIGVARVPEPPSNQKPSNHIRGER